MKRKARGYSEYVEHPRYGRGPRFTDLCLRKPPLGYRLATYVSDDVIEGTAIEADLKRQTPSPIPVLYYFDLSRKCIDCGRPFIFFAEEQRYWYETLGFVLDSNCIRCIDCRNRRHDLERKCRRYEELLHQPDRTVDELIEMAECTLSLIENGLFHVRQAERFRMLLNRLSDSHDDCVVQSRRRIRERVLAIEAACLGKEMLEHDVG